MTAVSAETTPPRVLPHPWDLHIDQCRGMRCVWCKTTLTADRVVGGIEAGTGPGWDLRFCHPCVAAVLADARAMAGDGDHVPALPAYY